VSDQVRETVIRLMATQIASGVQLRAASPRNFKEFRFAHPSMDTRSGIQTVELPSEDYVAIAKLATEILKKSGLDITVEYDSSDGNRAFVAKLR